MGITKMVNYNFALDLFEKGKVPPTYTSINNERIGESYNNQGFTTTNTLFDDITEVKCIPDFLDQADTRVLYRPFQVFIHS